MRVWAKREFSDNSYIYCLDQMNRQQTMVHGKSSAMMAATTRSENDQQITTVYIGVSDPLLLAAYPGFDRAEVQSLPKEAKLLYGDLHQFREALETDPRRVNIYCRWR